jgi:eukaryotic-like serine/threonine-protein kinase
MMATAADELLGLTLPGNWVPYEKLPKKPNESGGYFSVGYLAKDGAGRVGFLKALDYARLLASADPAAVLALQTNAFNFEREILRICRERNLSRIVQVLDEGSIIPPGRGITEVVQYLVFELADGDARRQADLSKRYDPAWALKTLHQVAVGLSQLHSELIAHQDLKPSNVLTFGKTESKIADLGRAASQRSAAPHEDEPVPGDRTYASPECLYSDIAHDWHARRLGCDQYLLGSLIVSFFLGTALTPLVQERLHPDHRARMWKGTYEDVLPYIRQATRDVLIRMENQMPATLAAKSKREIVGIVSELCEPDCHLRGHPLDRAASRNSRSLQRYVSFFDRLSKQAAIAARV